MTRLADELNKALRGSEERREPSGFWRPSQLGFCDRRNVLDHAGVEQLPLDAATLRTFWMGKEIHAAFQKRIPFPLIGHELEFEGVVGAAKIHGRLDTYVMNDGLREVIEFKSVKGSSWKYGDRPHDHHLMQLGCYLKWPILCPNRAVNMLFCPSCGGTGEHTTLPEPERGRLVYWNKDDGELDEHVIVLDDILDKAIEDEINRLEISYQKYVILRVLPEPIGTKTALDRWSRAHCPFRGRGCCADKA